VPHPRRLAVLAIPLLLATACNHKSPQAGPAPDVSQSLSASAASASASAASASASASAASASASGHPGTSAPTSHGTAATSAPPATTTAPGGGIMPLTMALAHACVSPGGTQRVDIAGADPGSLIAVDTTYSDGKEGKTHGGLKPDGQVNSQGKFTYSWTVLPGTPSGTATTFAGAAKGQRHGSVNKMFEVKTVC
jgi:hypothetical protein